MKIALRRPDLFAFVGGLSTAIDVPQRGFAIQRFHQSRHYNAIFGPSGSQTRRDNDPFILARSATPESLPYFFLTCGEQEGLLPPNREFAPFFPNVTSRTSSTLFMAVTTGLSGMAGCRACSKASRSAWN